MPLSTLVARSARRSASRRRLGFAFLLMTMLGSVLTACAPSAASDPLVAMRVNGTAVSLASYQQALALFDASAALQGAGTTAPLAWQAPGDRQTLASAQTETINFFKNTMILKQQLDAQHLTVPQQSINAAIAQLNAQVAQARAQSISNPTNTGLKALADAATPDAIMALAQQEAYTLTLASKGSVPTVKARAILVNTQAEASTILNDLKSGQDFATLARAHSIDTTSAANGGDLGTVYAGQLKPIFDTQAFLTMKGTGNFILPLNPGYGVFQIVSRGVSPLSALNNAQTQQQYLTAWVTNVLMPEAQVEIYVG